MWNGVSPGRLHDRLCREGSRVALAAHLGTMLEPMRLGRCRFPRGAREVATGPSMASSGRLGEKRGKPTVAGR